MDLNRLSTFVAVVEAMGISAAAARLGAPKSSVSRALAALEKDLGRRLVQRTTRRVSLTPEGTALYRRIAPGLRAVEEGLAGLPGMEEPSGRLRVTATVDFGATVLADVLARFRARYPHVSVEVYLSNEIVDLVGRGYDVALRVAPHGLKDSSLIARRAAVLLTQLYASPTYLARRGMPRSPRDLDDHDRIEYRGARPFELRSGGRFVRVRRQGQFIVNDMFFARAAVKAGAGIALLPTFLADPDVLAGDLVRVLPRWNLPSGAVYVVYPGAPQIPARVTAFRDLVLQAMRGQ